nr:aldehyde oxidase GLOX-like [Ipomoea batatas]
METQLRTTLPSAFTALALFLIFLITPCNALNETVLVSEAASGEGKWQLLLENTGVVAMHMALTHRNTVVFFDQRGSGGSGYQLRRRFNGTRCKGSREDLSDPSCYAHSVEYDLLNNTIRPLRFISDTWCSSGTILSNGTIMQTGGYRDGSKRIQFFSPCVDRMCNWRPGRKHLADERWYASNQILPGKNDRVIIVGGKRAFTFEFVPRFPNMPKSTDLPFLHQTYERNSGGNNLYPFLHLSSDGYLFIFANRDSILFNYRKNKVVKKFPRMPGEGSRSYPSTGSSVILPLDHKNRFQRVEVMICGGATAGAYAEAKQGRYVEGQKSCGRMVITGNKHKWNMENMPGPRLMNDMVILPTGQILTINGVKRGCAGWGNGASPAFEPYIYSPGKTVGKRFSVLRATKIARMYHSTATLLPDGRVLIAGSNPNDGYFFTNVPHPTELRLQAFVPDYMDRQYDNQRPKNVTVSVDGSPGAVVTYGKPFRVRFWLDKKRPSNDLDFSAYSPPFTTHSIAMNQRMLKLKCRSMERGDNGMVNAVVEAPPSPMVAPAGYYMLTVVHGGIPSISHWVKFMNAA